MRKWWMGAVFALGIASVAHAEGGSMNDADGNGHGQGHDEHRVLKLFDGQGRAIAPLVAFQSPGVVLDVNGTLVFAPIQRAKAGAVNLHAATRYEWQADFGAFVTPDCSGASAIVAGNNTALRPVQLVRKGTDVTMYIAADTNSTQTTFASFQFVGGQGLQCGAGPETLESWPTESTYPITQHYPEPLTIHY